MDIQNLFRDIKFTRTELLVLNTIQENPELCPERSPHNFPKA